MEYQTSSERLPKRPTGTVLCADDFGQTSSISSAIALLARKGVIDAVSAMTLMHGWPEDAKLLADRAPHVQVGLHLVLCDEVPLGGMPSTLIDGRLPSTGLLTSRAVSRNLHTRELADEIDRQFAAFNAAMGRPPDFVDAHKHCHLLPTLRSLVLDATVKHAPGAWVRSCGDRFWSLMARPFRWKAFGSALWSFKFRTAARRRGLITNDSFAGHYDYKRAFAPLLPRFRTSPGKFHLIMCHPGEGYEPDDPIAEAREKEYRVLAALHIANSTLPGM
jgi:predicted glycoside hydrolase/deacetylase ChbG (UPF0249 family)